LGWLDLQGIKKRLKKANKIFDAFVEKLLEDHVHRLMVVTSNGQGETEEEPLKYFVDVILEMVETYISTKTQIASEMIKAIIFVCLRAIGHSI